MMMTKTQRERWETKTLEEVRKHLRTNLAFMTLRSAEEKKEVETQVMAEVQEAVAETSDRSVEEGFSLPSFDSHANSLAMEILHQQALTSQFEWDDQR
jgi:5-carboxymethyl-2-hydroxymuconate isomerase